MPAKLSTTVAKIALVPNKVNAGLIREYHRYLQENGSSERHQNNALKAVLAYANHLGRRTTFLNIKRKDQITAYLDRFIKNEQEDPEKKWITTWNDTCHRIKHLFRWLYCQRGKEETIPSSEWQTPEFAKIKDKKTKRLSPYSETEIWDKDELLTIVKYEPHIRNKAALVLFWDVDARNHEVTMLKIKHVRLREKYAEGEIPHESKTGTGPILLTCSFPYVRDLLNVHPFRNNPDARLICNLRNGNPVKPEAMWTMMKQLRKRIERLLKTGEITDPKEIERLEYLLKTKRWNPYCLRHSAISYDSDSLPEFALRKKVRWSMNSKQPARYIKRRMGENLKNHILSREGIIPEEQKEKPSIRVCPRCQLVNAQENKYCSAPTCGYPLTTEAYEEIKRAEKLEVDALKEDVTVLRNTVAEFKELLKHPEKLAQISRTEN